MRIRETLPPFLQNVVLVLWAMGYGVNFFVAISALWGWRPYMGAMGCFVLFAMAWDDRKTIRQALKGELKRGDRLLALYFVGLLAIALAFNAALAVWWLLRR